MLAAAFALALQTEGSDARPLSLDDAWKLGLRSGFAISSARDALRAAQIGEFDAKARFFPKLTPGYFRGPNDRGWTLDATQAVPWLGASLSAERTSRTIEGAQAPAVRTTDTSFTWSQPLLRGIGPNASLFDLRNARRGREAQERSLTLSKQRYMIDIARAYHEVLAQRQLLDISRQSASRSVELRRASEARLEVGLSNRLDVYRAQLAEAQADQAAVQAETALETALERFRFLLGASPRDAATPAPTDVTEPPAPAVTVDALVARALEARLDLAEARDQIDDARRAASLSRQNLLPDLSMNVRFTESRSGGATGSLSLTDRRWETFLAGSLPLEKASDISRARLSDIDVKARERAYEQKRLEVEADVRAAFRSLDGLRRSAATQRTAVEVADQQYRLASLRYQRGLASNFDVVDAESSLLAARTALAQLLASAQVARLELERATGALRVEPEGAR